MVDSPVSFRGKKGKENESQRSIASSASLPGTSVWLQTNYSILHIIFLFSGKKGKYHTDYESTNSLLFAATLFAVDH